MADHRKAQDAKQTNETAHQRQSVEPISQERVGLQPVELTTLQRSVDNPGLARPADVLNLQRAVGNRAVSRLFGSTALRRPRPVIQPFLGPALSEVKGPRVQTKLTVGPAGDHYEREADRVADQVMTMPAPVSSQPSVQRQAEEEEEVQTKPLGVAITPLVQRQAEEEEEEIQTKPLVQRQVEEEELQTKQLLQRQPEEEEEVQTKQLLQHQAEEEEEIQTKPLVQRQAEEEEELQTKSLVRRQADGSFEASSELESHLVTYKGSGSPLPDKVRGYMEPRFGADFSGVRVHTGSEAADLNRSLSAQAFTHGQDIYLGAGRYDPGTTAGKRLLAHELTHVVQQQPGVVQKTADPSATGVTNRNGNRNAAVMRRVEIREQAPATIQRNYAALGPMAKARIDQQSEEKYADKALEFEFKMAPKIMSDALANQAVDVLLTRVRTIVDAWAASTGRELGQTYEREFGWAGGDVYYGAFEMTADSIRQVFEDRSQPMRKKLKLVYNAVRNNNLSKWLKLAAIELDRKARGETPRDWKIKTATQDVVKERDKATGQIKSFVKGRAEKEIVKAGFAERSGMAGWLTPEQITSFAATAAREKKTEHSRSKRDVFGHDVISSVMGWKPATRKAHGERTGSIGGRLPRSEQRTLTVGDVPDLTDAEIDQIYKKQGKPKPDATERARFRSDPAAKIEWEQGGETIDIILGSESARAAAEVKARMEAGISGSTDLMLHAMENLGLGSSPELMKAMRLALAGWMLANRDHSFYEVYKAAESYGVPFVNSKTDPGFMYEANANLYPMQKEDFRATLPENVFPRHFLSTAYKDTLATSLPEATKDQNAFRASLRAQGVPDSILNTLDARATVELTRLSEVVAAQPIDRLDRMTKKLYAVRQIKHHSSFIYLGNTLGENQANALLNALLKTHHGGKGLVPEIGSRKNTLADAGIPNAILNVLTPKQMTALGAARQAVMGARVDPNTGAPDMTQIHKALRKLKIGQQHRDKIKEILVETYHGASPDKRRLAELERIAQMQRTTGMWFSWGHLGYLNGFAHAADIKDYALRAVRSPQGYGLYVSDKIFGSTKYGETPGYGVAVARLNDVPTIGKANPAQRAAIQALQYNGQPMQFEDLYQDDNYIGMLMVYQGEFGAFKWARLTTSAGVTVTTDLSTVDAAELLGLYNQIPDGKPAKSNMKIQAQNCGVDVSTWS